MHNAAKRSIVSFLVILTLSLITSSYVLAGAQRRLYENFDDQVVNFPFTARAYGLWNIIPPTHSWGLGRGGGGYSYGSGDIHAAFVSYERGSAGESWPYGNEIYLSWYMKYPSWNADSDGFWNAKFFYLPERGSSGHWEMDATGNGSDGFFWQISGNGVIVESGWSSIPNAWDGNWHRYEIYIHRTQGIYRFRYDGNLVINRTYGQIMSTQRYDLSFGSIDAEKDNEFTRFIDDIEIWDGMPDAAPAPKPPTGLKIVN